MLFAAAMSIIGVQMVWLAIFSKVFGVTVGFLPKDSRIERGLQVFTLERGLLVGLILFFSGLFLSGKALMDWASVHYGRLDPTEVMRTVIPAVSMIITGIEFILATFFLGVLQIERRQH